MRKYEVEIHSGPTTVVTIVDARDEFGVMDFLTNEPFIVSHQAGVKIFVPTANIDAYFIKEVR
jgi:hypothetical protein